jgi:multidrug efflux system membrane fusion protein
VVAVAIGLGVLGAGCSKESGGAAKPNMKAPVPVMVATACARPVPMALKTFGNIEANVTVAVKSQVTGTLLTLNFKEGQFIKEGDLLFEIDKQPFEAALHQAEANLARDQAQYENAKKEADRQAELLKKGVAAPSDYDAAQTAAVALAGTLKADQAAIDQAKINVAYCTIRSPVDARAGVWMVDKGNLVSANASTLVVLNQVHPIQMSFAVPEGNLLEIQQQAAKGKLKVLALIPGHEAQPEEGELHFVDNTVDRTTGTIHLKALFPNPRDRLWPGQFVDAVLVLYIQPDAIVIPSQAIQTGQKGTFVFVVKADGTVEDRPITIDRPINSETVVAKGLAKGETVVVDGQLRLVPGSKIVEKSSLDEAAHPEKAKSAPAAGEGKEEQAKPETPEAPKKASSDPAASTGVRLKSKAASAEKGDTTAPPASAGDKGAPKP